MLHIEKVQDETGTDIHLASPSAVVSRSTAGIGRATVVVNGRRVEQADEAVRHIRDSLLQNRTCELPADDLAYPYNTAAVT